LDLCCQSAGLGSAGTDCEAQTLENYQDQLTVTSQRAVSYDPRAAARCVAAFTSFLQSCSYEGKAESDAACAAVFAGTRIIGESCDTDLECAHVAGSDVYCESDIGAHPNTCQQVVPQDGQCLLEGCAKGLFCDLSTLSCQPQVASGDCSLQFDTCSEDSACSPNLVCEPKLAPGEPCILSLQCRTEVCGSDGLCAGTLGNVDNCQP
jgi:hypothetical protein